MKSDLNALKVKLSEILPYLNEKQKRILVAAESRAYGLGGVEAMMKITGISRQTIYRGLRDLEVQSADNRIRLVGGGRKRSTQHQPELISALEKIIEPITRGDPESPLKWTCKSVRKLAQGLEIMGFSVSYKTVANILHEKEYRLQGNRKATEGKASHPDRNEQFHYINKKAQQFIKIDEPVISVDTKKKELVGNYKNNGREWNKKGHRIKVLTHDFPDPKVSKAVPYGVYDIQNNTGWVNVGISSDTSEFAVESIRQWWLQMGAKRYKKAKKLMICADCGGSNGNRSRLWKKELQKLANETKLRIYVCHFPPGTSKWNKIEHRLFSYISMNWRGRPLVDYQTVVNLIASTTTTSGLKVEVRIDKNKYKKGIKVSDEEFEKIKIRKNNFHGEWNYIIGK